MKPNACDSRIGQTTRAEEKKKKSTKTAKFRVRIGPWKSAGDLGGEVKSLAT